MKCWQKSYFYVKNVAPQGDYVNLPAGRRPHWSYRAASRTPAGAAAVARLRVMIQSEGLTGSVLLAAFITLCEGFLGVLPTIGLSGEFFQSKLGTRMQGVPAQSGAFIAMRRPAAEIGRAHV